MKTQKVIDIDIEGPGGIKAKIKRLTSKLYLITILATVLISIIALLIVYFIYE